MCIRVRHNRRMYTQNYSTHKIEAASNERYLGKAHLWTYIDMQLEMKQETKEFIVRNKSIPTRAREPADCESIFPLPSP